MIWNSKRQEITFSRVTMDKRIFSPAFPSRWSRLYDQTCNGQKLRSEATFLKLSESLEFGWTSEIRSGRACAMEKLRFGDMVSKVAELVMNLLKQEASPH